ncbi:unnamed protein product [Alopecurus aequalis]
MAAWPACLVALVVSLTFLLLDETAAAMGERGREARNLLRRLNKPPLATIQSPDGDVIDCVHISKQPAFDHPLLRNHTIQMRPSSHPTGMYHDSNISTRPITQTWHQNGKCPKNTIPIRRTKEEEVLRANSMRRYGMKRIGSIPKKNSINDPATSNVLGGHQHAVLFAQVDKCRGTKTSINLWQPYIAGANDFSLAQLWITRGSYSGNDLNTIEAGWQIYPYLYSDYNPRLFIYWTRDAYQTTGCYNLLCSGFIQVDNRIAIGGSLSSIFSTYDGTQYDFDILVWKEPKLGNWWLQVGGIYVGYWPPSIFSYLADSASSIMWGGEVFSPDLVQTSTEMGSGHFPNEGFGKASHMKNIQVVDASNYLREPNALQLITEQANCYNVLNGIAGDWGTYIYYGGPGKNPNCP